MPIKTTLYWATGILIVSGILVTFAADFTEQETAGATGMIGPESAAAVPIRPGEDRFVISDGPQGRIGEEPEAMAFEPEPDLDSWYAGAGASQEPFDPSPDDKSYLINSAEPTTDFKDEAFVGQPLTE